MSTVPSYKRLQPASETASRTKSRNRRQDTEHEVILRQALWRRGLRFRKNVQHLPGKPDIVFSRSRVVVFCDGDFWHGRNWLALKAKLEAGANPSYWLAKILSNRERDQRVTALLERDGWHVLRLWETDIRKDPEEAADQIAAVVRSRRAVK